MSRGRKWIKRGVWVIILLIVAGGITSGVLYHMVHGVPDWYQPDTSTDEEKRTAADKVEDLLARFRDHIIKPSPEKLAAKKAAALARANQQSAAQADKVVNEAPESPFDLELTDVQLNAFFQKWKTQARQEMLDEYVEDPRIVIRDSKLILVGRVKSMGIILSLIFEPRLDENGNFFLNLTRVQGGMLPVPDAAWSGKRQQLEQMLQKKLPGFQSEAASLPDSCVNGDAGSAAINEMLLAVLRGTSSPAVVFVPVETYKLVPSIPVKVTAMTVQGHSIKMTAQKMTTEEQAAYLKRIKTMDPETLTVPGDHPKK